MLTRVDTKMLLVRLHVYSVPKRSVHFLMLNISKISRRFFCKFGMVSPKYTIHRSNIKPMPCWAKIFDFLHIIDLA